MREGAVLHHAHVQSSGGGCHGWLQGMQLRLRSDLALRHHWVHTFSVGCDTCDAVSGSCAAPNVGEVWFA